MAGVSFARLGRIRRSWPDAVYLLVQAAPDRFRCLVRGCGWWWMFVARVGVVTGGPYRHMWGFGSTSGRVLEMEEVADMCSGVHTSTTSNGESVTLTPALQGFADNFPPSQSWYSNTRR